MNLTNKDILYLQNRVAYMRCEQSYKQLFFHYYHSLKNFANGIVKNNEVAEEIVSDVMMKIWDANNKLAQIEKLDAYLFTAVKNACFTQLQKNKLSTQLVDDDAINEAINYQCPHQILEETEVISKINEAINNLPPQCLMVFKLIKEQGFSYKKVSAILEISQNTIETHMRIALKKIRLSLTNYLADKN